MTGWNNMPSGCNARDIPMVEMAQNKLAEVPAFVKLSEEEQMAIEWVVVKLMGKSWAEGQQSGYSDATMAAEVTMQGIINRLRVIVAALEDSVHG
jgi:hypothetical protein